MTPLQILDAALHGKPAPRIPIFCNLLDQGAREMGLAPKAYFKEGACVAEAQLRLLKRYGHDNVWSLHYVGKEAELLGCQDILFPENGPPNVADFVIKSWDDIAKFEVPDDITQHPAWQTIKDCLSILRQELGGTHPICAYVTASTTLPAILMGMDKWMELLLLGPTDLRDELLQKCNRFVQKNITALRAAGANVLLYASPFGSSYFVNKKILHNLIMPWMQRDVELGGAADMVYYCGMAPFNDVIDDVLTQLHIKAHYISPLADLAEAKQLINSRGLTCGIIDDIQMIHWSAEQTRAEVKRIIATGKSGGHFLFGTGVMPLAIPETNIKAMLDAAFEYGELP